METTFKTGQTVRATITAQGMIKGAAYLVTLVHKEQSPWGTFVTYTLDGPACPPEASLSISNGHLLLEAV